MKRLISHCLILLLLLSACGGQAAEPQIPAESMENPPLAETGADPAGDLPPSAPALGAPAVPPEAGLTYSNLSGEGAAAQVRQVLEDAGVEKARVEKFFVWVADFNAAMKGCSAFTLQDGFVTIDGPTADYGEYPPASTLWYKTNNRRYSDILCRIAAFQLMGQFLTVGTEIDSDQWEVGENQWLCSDYDAITNFPLVNFSQQEINNYFALYQPILVDPDIQEAQIAQRVEQVWKEREISFAEGPVSLMTVWIRSGGRIAAGHAAVLVEGDEVFWVVEKTNPQSPYQAAVFSTREQAAEYLYQAIRQDDLKYGLKTGPCVVFQNDRPLAQYPAETD